MQAALCALSTVMYFLPNFLLRQEQTPVSTRGIYGDVRRTDSEQRGTSRMAAICTMTGETRLRLSTLQHYLGSPGRMKLRLADSPALHAENIPRDHSRRVKYFRDTRVDTLIMYRYLYMNPAD